MEIEGYISPANKIRKAIEDSKNTLLCGHTESTFNFTEEEILEKKIDQILDNQIIILEELLSIRTWNG